MQRKEKLKRSSLRYAEYYNMTQIQDSLFQQSKSGRVFTDLIRIIASEQNIKLAYRNLKNNKGLNTPPCGVPFSGMRLVPFSSMGAFSILLMRESRHLSCMPNVHICFRSFPWSTLSKKPLMSISTT